MNFVTKEEEKPKQKQIVYVNATNESTTVTDDGLTEDTILKLSPWSKKIDEIKLPKTVEILKGENGSDSIEPIRITYI